MGARRSADELARARASLWDIVRFEYYAQWQGCDRCGQFHYCAGKRKDKLLCQDCHMQHASV